MAKLDAEFLQIRGHRVPFTLQLPLDWHTKIHQGCVHVPVPQYVGHYRGEPLQYLSDCPAFFGPFAGSSASRIATDLATFEAALVADLDKFDALIADPKAATSSRLNLLVESLAGHYAAWIRIHPFVDGTGRTSRLLANWISVRYWQPLILPGRPPADRIGLIRATTPAVANVGTKPLVILLRNRLAAARRAAVATAASQTAVLPPAASGPLSQP